jgi:hypothetical protein
VLQPSDDVTVYVVLHDYDKLGYEETDPAKARSIGPAAGRRTNFASGRSFAPRPGLCNDTQERSE